jgi:hypothetical protein
MILAKLLGMRSGIDVVSDPGPPCCGGLPQRDESPVPCRILRELSQARRGDQLGGS